MTAAPSHELNIGIPFACQVGRVMLSQNLEYFDVNHLIQSFTTQTLNVLPISLPSPPLQTNALHPFTSSNQVSSAALCPRNLTPSRIPLVTSRKRCASHPFSVVVGMNVNLTFSLSLSLKCYELIICLCLNGQHYSHWPTFKIHRSLPSKM